MKFRASSAMLVASMAAISFAQSGYRIGEDSASADAGPVRMARFDYLAGKVDFRPTSSLGWSTATRNLPVRQGAQIWTPVASKAELQFDDGSDMRLADGAVASLVTLYSDSHGEFTEIKLTNGLATLHLTNKNSLYQIDTPNASIKAYGPALIRIGDTSGIEIAVKSGQAVMQGVNGNFTLNSGQYLNLPDKNCPCTVKHIPPADAWDKFNESRDQVVYRQAQYVPANIGLVSGELDTYGDWHDDKAYGHVWVPREHHDWTPYHDGRWVWEDPYGWTWVGDEDWGWAPYHYGTWVHESDGWGWCPGPERQCWSPAVVSFSNYDNNVAWCPLGPREVRYSPAFEASFGVGSLLLSFSIGRAGCYYPVSGGYCEPRPWDNVFINRVTNVYDIHRINTYYGDSGLGRAWGRNNFVPGNARFGGGTFVSANGFGGRGGFRSLPGAQASVFSRGRSFGMPTGNAGQISGPFNVRPAAGSFTPSRQFVSNGPSSALLNRGVYRSGVPTYAARNSVGVGHAITPNGNTNAGRFARGAAIGAGVVGAAALAHGAANRFAHNPGPASATNRYSRFNSVSHSAFTRSNAGGAGHRESFGRSGAANAARRPIAAAHAGSFGRRGPAIAGRTAAQAATHGRMSAPARSAHPMARARAATHAVAGRARQAIHHAATRIRSVAHSAARRAFPNRNAHSVDRAPRNFSRPSRSFSRPARSFSAPRVNRPSAPRASRPSFQRPAPQRSFGGGGGFGGGRPSGGSFGGGRPMGGGGRPSGGGGGRPSAPPRPSGGGGRPGGGDHRGH